ncbi:uncharacterized protein SPPG_09272 [Spizellomyces punctatus DAOM BR117]|uniref:Uncharacterized protein n=1 Tax=Spizellomyces punctatus (strain DAOM BR117) TaxID=645134 RepID=A0A0L0HDM6_SPIPD|nr:uncharacterized protein SPPG_09272 [Spizellomyces punctatus DAOM BR117]KNC99111.1 hypothetical protein SPPG_09272 [Spizellomyces punctatus DAOM BR117]|eukprot:XP_016607151.1 hypothetical protein SPPG_09272 [Spizellomyces punctatus DAOM BR117]
MAYNVSKTLTFLALVGGMMAGSTAVHRWLKPDMSIPDLLGDQPRQSVKQPPK